jgi:hypothetical protein
MMMMMMVMRISTLQLRFRLAGSLWRRLEASDAAHLQRRAFLVVSIQIASHRRRARIAILADPALLRCNYWGTGGGVNQFNSVPFTAKLLKLADPLRVVKGRPTEGQPNLAGQDVGQAASLMRAAHCGLMGWEGEEVGLLIDDSKQRRDGGRTTGGPRQMCGPAPACNSSRRR